MRHRSAVDLLKSLTNILAVCLDEHRRQGIDFDRTAWAELRDLVESPTIVEAFATLDERTEDRTLADDVSKLIADVVCVTETEQDMSPEEFEKRLREACPLFTEVDLRDDADATHQIRNRMKTAAIAKSAAKPPAPRVVRSDPLRPGVARQKVFDVTIDWADIDAIQAKTGFSRPRVRGVLNKLKHRFDHRTTSDGRVEFKYKK